MRKYRNEAITQKPNVIPVLIRSGWKNRDGSATFLPGFQGVSPVRVLGEEALEMFVNDGPRFQKLYGHVSDAESNKFLGLLQLAKAHQPGEYAAAKEAHKRLLGASSALVQALQTMLLESDPQGYLAREMSKGSQRVRLVLWYTPQRQLLPGLYCLDALAALYALAVARIATGHGLGACLVCGKPLIRWRTTRKTCSDKCKQKLYRQAHRQKNSRRSNHTKGERRTKQ